MTDIENVLCTTKAEFDKRDPFVGFQPLDGRSDMEDYLNSKPPISGFKPRDQVEDDESILQIIPYISFAHKGSVFCYKRQPKGGDPRLDNLLSIGVGGHVNDNDDPEEPFWAFACGALREVKEEVGISLNHDALQGAVVGMLYDDSTPVGRVHLGVSIILEVDEEARDKIVANAESKMLEPKFVQVETLQGISGLLENWSRYVIEFMHQISTTSGYWEDAGFRERLGMLGVTAGNLSAAASGWSLQHTAHGNSETKAVMEDCIGQLECILSGMIQNGDIDGAKVQEKGAEFYSTLGSIMRHQHIEPPNDDGTSN